MKIFHVLHGFAPELTGGTELAVEALARAMQGAGHEVAVVTGSIEVAPSERVDELDVDGLRVLRMHREDLYFEEWPKTWSPEVGARFAELLAAERPDVVHVHHWIRLTSDLVRIARAAGCATAVTMHDYFTTFATPVRRHDADEPEPPDCSVHVGAAERAEALRDHRDDFADEIRAAHLRYAPCRAHAAGVQATADVEFGEIGVTPPPLLRVPPRLPERESRQRRLVTWGSLYPDKGLDLVLDALFSIGSGWTLDVYGEAHDPAYRDRLATRAQQMPVTLHGAFTPDDLGQIEADYAVLPSLCHESYGMTIDEAQCLGLPIIASDLPSFREHAAEKSSVFFPPGDAGALAMVLLDEARLQALETPAVPILEPAERVAARLLHDYAAAQRGERAPLDGDVLMTPERRARAMFRRAERRNWSACQRADRKAPPDDFLRRR